MIKTSLPAKRAIASIVRSYRNLQRKRMLPLPLRDFSGALSEVLEPIGGKISHQSVKNWEAMVHLPHAFYMKQIVIHARKNWQQDFARDVLAVLFPGECMPATRVGVTALEQMALESNPIRSGQAGVPRPGAAA